MSYHDNKIFESWILNLYCLVVQQQQQQQQQQWRTFHILWRKWKIIHIMLYTDKTSSQSAFFRVGLTWPWDDLEMTLGYKLIVTGLEMVIFQNIKMHMRITKKIKKWWSKLVENSGFCGYLSIWAFDLDVFTYKCIGKWLFFM